MGMDLAPFSIELANSPVEEFRKRSSTVRCFRPGARVRLRIVATSPRQGRMVVLSMHVTIAGQVRAIEGDRLVLLAGTIVRIPPELDVPRLAVGFGVTVVAEEHGGELTALNIRPSLGPFVI